MGNTSVFMGLHIDFITTHNPESSDSGLGPLSGDLKSVIKGLWFDTGLFVVEFSLVWFTGCLLTLVVLEEEDILS